MKLVLYMAPAPVAMSGTTRSNISQMRMPWTCRDIRQASCARSIEEYSDWLHDYIRRKRYKDVVTGRTFAGRRHSLDACV